MPARQNKPHSGNKHSANLHRSARKYGTTRHMPAKAGKRQGPYIAPPWPNPEKAKASASGEQQFFSDHVRPYIDVVYQGVGKHAFRVRHAVIGVYDATRKRVVRPRHDEETK